MLSARPNFYQRGPGPSGYWSGNLWYPPCLFQNIWLNIYILTSFIRFWCTEIMGITVDSFSISFLWSLIWSWAWARRIFKTQSGINIKGNQNLRLLTFLAVPCFGFNHVPSNVDTRCWFVIFASSLSTFRIRFTKRSQMAWQVKYLGIRINCFKLRFESCAAELLEPRFQAKFVWVPINQTIIRCAA